MASYLEKFKRASALNRRSFVKAGATATVALAAGGSLVACSAPAKEEGGSAAGGEGGAPVEEGVWMTAACWHNCGGRCLNKVLIKDGLPIRQKTDDTHEDSPDYPQQRGCLRGRSQSKQVFLYARFARR